METAFPLTALKREEHLSAAVQVAIPFRIFLVFEVSPHIVVQLLEPLEALFVSCKLIALDHSDGALEVNPPEFLIPFELLCRIALAVHKVEDAAVFLVPAIFDYAE